MADARTRTEIEFEQYRLEVTFTDRERYRKGPYSKWCDSAGNECSKSESIEDRGRYRVDMDLYYTYTDVISVTNWLLLTSKKSKSGEDLVAASSVFMHTIGGVISKSQSELIETMESEISDEEEWEQDVDTFESCIDTIDTDRIADVADQITAGEEYG